MSIACEGGKTISPEEFWTDLGPKNQTRLLTGELVVTKPLPIWQIWRTIRLDFQNPKELDWLIKRSGLGADDLAIKMIYHPKFFSDVVEREIDLVLASPADLGYKQGEVLRVIFQQAKAFGLDLCPPIVGPSLFLQYEDQPECEELFIAMLSISVAGSDRPKIFTITRSFNRQRFGCEDGHSCFVWPASRRLVFCRRRLSYT